MARFGEFKAQFFARTNLNTPLSDGASIYRVPVSGVTHAVMSGMGRTELIFGYDALIGNLIAEGHVCICYQYDDLNSTYVGGVPFCLPFEIESVTPIGPGLIRIEGPDLLDWLLDTQWFAPIGGGTETATTVAVAVSDPAATTVAVAAPVNNDSIVLSSVTGWQVGDEARIALDNGGLHVTVVRTVEPPGAPANTIQIVDLMPSAAGVTNTVTRRRRRVQVAAGQGAAFQTGVECRLTLDDSTVHTTLIAAEPEGDLITMQDGAPDGAAVGKAIKATDYSQPTTSDVTTIMSYMAGWSVEFDGAYSGTAAGTHHAPHGDSVYELLVATAKATGEFFRLKSAGVAAAPSRTVQWKRSFDYAGQSGNLRLVQPTQAGIDTDAANVNRGIITGDVEREGLFQVVTRVVPLAGDKRITLKLCSEEARLQAMVEGFTLVDTGLGLYTPPYLKNAASEAALGMIARTVTFSQVRVETDNATEWVSAADHLMRLAIAYLYEHGAGVRYRYTVPDVVTAIPIAPGQRVEMVYTSPDGRWSVNATGSNALYVLEVRAQFAPPEEDVNGNLNDRGKLLTLILADSPWEIPDVAAATATAIAEAGRVARIASGDGGMMGAATIIMGGGGTGGTDDHGELTGLADDDHPQYLRADGTRALAGNLTVNSNVTIDGVDISAHAANPSAHHAPVTVADNSLTLSAQELSVKLSSGGGLVTVLGGLMLMADSAGGLELAAGSLRIKLPTNSGLVRDANGLALSPSTLTAATTNALSGAGHTHAVTATADATAGTANTLLKTGAAGELAVARLGVGVATVTTAAGYFQSQANDDYALLIKQKSGQTAELWRVEDVAGNALIRLTGGGDLESGYPGFVSRVTGWQIEHDGGAEFNNVFVRGELHAATFVADEMHATGGTLAVMTAAKVSTPVNANDNVLPAIGSTFTLNVQASWDSGLCYFAVNDVIRIKPMGEIVSGGSLDLYDIYMQVTATGSLTGRNLGNGNAGYYPMTVRRLGGGATGLEIPISAAVRWAKIGGTGYTGGMILSSDLPYSPYLDIFTIDATQSAATWQSAPVTPIPRLRLGNLRGVLGKSADEWGMAAGVNLGDTTTAARYIVASDQGIELRNAGLKIYSSGNPVVDIAYTGDIKAGTDTASGATTTFDFTASSGAVRFGPVGAGKANLFWGGSALHLRLNATPVITLDSDGSSYFSGPMSIGTSGGIWQGTGTFASPTTGIKLYRSGSIGMLETYESGNRQVRLDTDGALKAGWDGGASIWNVVLNASGLTLKAGTAVGDDAWISTQAKRVNWEDGGALKGWVAGRIYAGGQHGVEIAAASGVGIKIMNSPSARTPSYFTTDGTLFLQTPAGYMVNINNGLDMANTDIQNVGSMTIVGMTATARVDAATGISSRGPTVVGGTVSQTGITDNGVLVLVPRSSHPTAPNSNFTSLYIYHNTGTSKNELTLQNAAGTRVKVAEIASA